MNRPLNRAIERAINARTRIITIGLSRKSIFVSARNADFPKLSENAAARIMVPVSILLPGQGQSRGTLKVINGGLA